MLEGYDKALIISSKGWASRSVTEPESSKVIRGPREGFTESIIVNLTLLRRKIKNPELKFKFKDIGIRTNTKVCISYIEGLAQDSIIRELEKRLNDIQIDGILDSGIFRNSSETHLSHRLRQLAQMRGLMSLRVSCWKGELPFLWMAAHLY